MRAAIAAEVKKRIPNPILKNSAGLLLSPGKIVQQCEIDAMDEGFAICCALATIFYQEAREEPFKVAKIARRAGERVLVRVAEGFCGRARSGTTSGFTAFDIRRDPVLAPRSFHLAGPGDPFGGGAGRPSTALTSFRPDRSTVSDTSAGSLE
ncbi:MAG TPA: hypothetical protein VGV37_11265 [Aliidongia sp.]|uniref:hypothetical protein n=1 Tax=Aliidongia sp. TaxID=1914230 RepID=UPI002DDCDE16|nr:hypothetical protein [Aliidongia sp.]HEV2675111.1 hypothetical protein [Aliidongia sp.]